MSLNGKNLSEPDALFPFFKGVAKLVKGERGVIAHRMTDAQMSIYADNKIHFGYTVRPSGVVIALRCSSDCVSFGVAIGNSSGRPVMIDVFENGVMTDTVDPSALPDGILRYSRVFTERESSLIEIYLPVYAETEIYDVDFGDCKPVETAKHRLMIFGDSISMGMFALHPSMMYPHLLARYIGAEICSAAVGDAVFDPRIIDFEHPFKPDTVISAYGTNDCSYITDAGAILATAEKYFYRMKECYPDAAVNVITPIWLNRIDSRHTPYDSSLCQRLRTVSDGLFAICEKHGFNCIDGNDICPHHPAFYEDKTVHPNDEGFAFYALGVLKKLKLGSPSCGETE